MTPPNDWQIKKCLVLSLTLLLAMLGLVALAGLGIDVPGLRQIVGFIFLLFIPGILLLRLLKIHNIGIVESLLYSVGLSLAFIMVSGLFANFALPVIGISKPISAFPIMVTLTIFTIILMAIAYWRDKGFSASIQTKLTGLFPPATLFLISVLLLTILGAFSVNLYHNNILLLIITALVAGIAGLGAFGRFIDHKVYPLAIAVIALSLLYQSSFLSPYLTGTDIHLEYYFEQIVVEKGYWNPAIPHNYNSGLSIVLLAPIYSVILNIDGAWVFKTIYPFIFSLMPLALFHSYRQQMSDKKAFLAAFFFLAVPTFSLEIMAVAKQQIAELFFALFILLMVTRKLEPGQRLTLAIIFTLSLAATHYGLGSVSLMYLALGWLLFLVIRSWWGRKVWGWLTGGLPQSLTSPRALSLKAISIVVAIYFLGSLAYYGWAATGLPLKSIVSIWEWQVTPESSELAQLVPGTPSEPGSLFNLANQEPLLGTAFGLDFASASSPGKGFRVFQYITQLFLIIGFIRLVFRPKKLRFTPEYIAFTGASALVLLACIVLPLFSGMFNITRFYHVSLFFLAPLCVLGGEAIWRGVSGLFNPTPAKTEDNQAYLGFLALAILIPYFLFTSGFVFEVTKYEVTDRIDTPYSFALSSHRMDVGPVFNRRDGAAAKWVGQALKGKSPVFGDLNGMLLLSQQTTLYGRVFQFAQVEKVPLDSYIYFRTWNIDRQEVTFQPGGCWFGVGVRKSVSFSEAGMNEVIRDRNLIYSNSGAQVLAPANPD